MRPCTCDKFIVGEPWVIHRDCRLCWLYHNDIGYKTLWDNMPVLEPQPPISKEEQEKISFAQRMAAFAKAMAVEASWRAQGGRAPTVEEKAERRAHCDSNLCGALDKKNDLCLACGCYLEAGLFPPRPMGKLDCSTQKCPKGYWGTVGGYVSKGGCGG